MNKKVSLINIFSKEREEFSMQNERIESFIEENQILHRSKNNIDSDLLKDMKELCNIIIEEYTQINTLYYIQKNGSKLQLPYTFLLATMVPEKSYETRMYTLMRYSILNELEEEYELHLGLLTEIIERLEKANEIWDHLKENQKEAATKTKKNLETVLCYLKYGFALTNDMLNVKKRLKSHLDTFNPTVLKLIELNLI